MIWSKWYGCFRPKYKKYTFNSEGISKIKSDPNKGQNWPVVYILSGEKEASFNTAIHEAGHAVMAYKYNDIFEICSASVDDDVGYVKTTIKPKYSCLSSTFIKQIEIGLAGYLAEKLICHEISSGSADDLEQVSKLAKNLINLFAIKKLI